MPRTHLFFITIISLLAGLAAGAEWPRSAIRSLDPFILAPIVFSTLLALSVLTRLVRHSGFRRLTLAVIGCLVGLGWTVGYRASIEPGPLPYDREVTITGRVVSFPELLGRRQEFVLTTDDFGRPTKIRITVGREPIAVRGATVKLVGRLTAPQNRPGFAEVRWLEGRGIFGRIRYPKTWRQIDSSPPVWTAINRLRERIMTAFRSSLPEPAASLALGLSIGIDPEIDRDFSDHLKRTNLTHLAAVSGQNLTLSILFLFQYLRRFWLKGAIWICLALLAIYTILTGAEASVVRASLMNGLALMGLLVGRPADMIRMLLMAVLTIALANPLGLTHDIGFGLSVFAMAGILLFQSPIVARLSFLPEEMANLAAATTAATVSVLPLQIASFGTVSLVGLVANLTVGPLVVVAMGGALMAALVAAALPNLAAYLGILLYAPLELIHQIATALGRLPTAQVSLSVPPAVGVGLVLVAALGFAWLVWRRLMNPWLAILDRRLG